MLHQRLDNIVRFCQKCNQPASTTSYSHLEINPEKNEYYFLTHHTTGRRYEILQEGVVVLPSDLDEKEQALFENNIKSLENIMTTRRHPGPYLDEEYPEFGYERGI